MNEQKSLLGVYGPASEHWVGDGFPVRNLFPSNDLGHKISPFLLLDYAGPMNFPPAQRPRGVGEHPHRGFETVTLVYQGALAHRDSAGNQGTIGPGDVQWMTAASGVVHEEMHEVEFTRRGGTFQVVQLWVNLPKAYKMSPPRYQGITAAQIPAIELDRGGALRVIAGEFRGEKGPAQTFTPVNLYDARVPRGGYLELDLPDGFNTAVVVLSGEAIVNGGKSVHEAELALFDPRGRLVHIEAAQDSLLLVLSGEPIHEPVASAGPFVMNTREELLQASSDYRSGKMGHLD
jgi:redox-sensitive bicupin YhaK (pirin superfamily)